MIKGIGTDIIELSRIEKAIRNKSFVNKYFTEKEINLFIERNWSVTTIASNFAIKEAVSKVLGTGFRAIELVHIEVLRDSLGKPYVLLYSKAKELQKELGIQTLFVSTSHNKESVVAFAIGEGDL
ncbi:holo-[acyl-carrier-protein] synthase [Natranaerovirga pectinivora]|uniref:Holo-[acyl-carrier-protein] synthase n=1 Tax=Natranaerovirga pectinivora TaxID=682400 RepID=A0A4R3ML41_9FIRM|nr:holo-ACP synthase [Natranaerovirga pectinivora]TCT15328.1 holo-[acyl-carrier-protein] synthase [Natranaerovirga pectinivora]